MGQLEIQKILISRLEESKRKNPSISLRAFSARLGIAPGTLSQVLAGKRRVSKKMAIRLATVLNLEGEDLSRFLSSFSSCDQPNRQSSDMNYVRLQMDQYAIISKWYHMGIMNLVKLDDFQSDETWIARRLGISEQETTRAIERLINVGMLKKVDDQLERSAPQYETSDDVANFSLRSAHKENLKLASEAIDQVDINKRDVTAMTFAIDLDKIPKAKKMIREFQDELSDFLTEGKKNEVYKLTMQLFPLTKLGEE